MIAVIPNAHAANRMTDIFISYSRHDQAWVAKLARALEDVGYSVWWDTQLLAGDDAMSHFKSGVSFAGYNGWRMPTKDELKTLAYCRNGKHTPLPDQGIKTCGVTWKRADKALIWRRLSSRLPFRSSDMTP